MNRLLEEEAALLAAEAAEYNAERVAFREDLYEMKLEVSDLVKVSQIWNVLFSFSCDCTSPGIRRGPGVLAGNHAHHFFMIGFQILRTIRCFELSLRFEWLQTMKNIEMNRLLLP